MIGREAVLAFDEALRYHTRERAPGHWAAGQNDRALALLASSIAWLAPLPGVRDIKKAA